MKSNSHLYNPSKTLNLRGKLLDLSTPHIMGILNVTPDSFFDGNRYVTEDAILGQTEKVLSAGATFIDIGGYSSRPGAEDISEAEEIRRAVGAVKLIIKKFPTAILSIDSFRSEVARQAILEGASIINDISAGEQDQQMFATVAKLRVPYIIMHMRGTPQTMKTLTEYENLVKEVTAFLQEKIRTLESLEIKDVIIDPGFGFAKTIEQNFQLLEHLNYFNILDRPMIAGISRKSMIWKTLGIKPEDALNGTTALNMTALMKGATILRVHDVKEAMEVVRLYKKLKE
ncbi:MAG TPA: dihydropteroate synthase [Cyclobacteriaceae bacterium]|nr:dihydropteroate synthase [Cyclobacteriaceae bacterium]